VLGNEAERRRASGGGFYLINVKQGLWDSLEETHTLDKIDANNVFQSKSSALRGIFQKLDKSVCANCTARIFNECQSVKFAGDPKLIEHDDQSADEEIPLPLTAVSGRGGR
jgi:SulP family sulfate permease